MTNFDIYHHLREIDTVIEELQNISNYLYSDDADGAYRVKQAFILLKYFQARLKLSDDNFDDALDEANKLIEKYVREKNHD